MAADSSDRMKIVIYYAAWASVCAAAAGTVLSLIHVWFFSYNPGPSWFMHTLFGDLVTALAIAAGQGAVALVTGNVLAQFGRTLQRTVLLGLLLGAFDFVMNFVQMAVPATEVGWVPDILILIVATVGITTAGLKSTNPA